MALTPTLFHAELSVKAATLLNAALNLYIRVGYNRVSLAQVIKAAGVGRSTFYRYFASKLDLYAAMLLYDELQCQQQLNLLQAHCAGDSLLAYFRYKTASVAKYQLLSALAHCLGQAQSTLPRYQRWQALRQAQISALQQQLQPHLATQQDAIDCVLWVESMIHGSMQVAHESLFAPMLGEGRQFMQFMHRRLHAELTALMAAA